MKIRPAAEADAQILAQIISAANIPVAGMFGLTRDNAPNHPSFCTREWIEKGMARGEAYYLAEIHGHAVGCVAYESPEPETAFLNRLAVIPEHQRQGMGRALVGHVIDLARARGNNQISIGIIHAHTVLKTWYESLGFSPAGVKQFPHLPFDVLFMHLLLTAPGKASVNKSFHDCV